jgi:peptidoglycan hydrolase CwlO-like protein
MSSALSAVAGSSSALQAELQKAQRELSACVNCDSAKTSSGQTQIATLRSEVQGIKQRIEKTNAVPDADAAAAAAASAAASAQPPGALSPVGNFLNVYA